MHITQELSIVVHGAQPRRRTQCKNNCLLVYFRKKLNLFTKLVYKQIGEALQSVK